jgi:hypothetical protein
MMIIPLSRGLAAKVDDEDFGLLSKYNWYASRDGKVNKSYAATTIRADGKKIFTRMHRMIMGNPVGMEVDHINKDTLDNTRVNLRLATRSQNQMNKESKKGGSSRFKGVTRHTQTGKYMARITLNGKTQFLGFSHDEVLLAKLYDKAAIELHGEFAVLNFNRSTS